MTKGKPNTNVSIAHQTKYSPLLDKELEEKEEERAEERRDKKEAHALFDSLWDLLFVPNEQKQQCRSRLYKAWGAVLLPELETVEGVLNPRVGGQHIANMSAEQREKCKKFIKCLLQEHEGDIVRIATRLSLWADNCNKRIEPIKTDEQKIREVLDNDSFIQHARSVAGISALPVVLPAEPSPAIPITHKLTALEHYIEGVVAKIDEDHEAMMTHFVAAADRGHAQAAWQVWEIKSSGPDDRDMALHYLDIAANNGYVIAQHAVQKLYKAGELTPHLKNLIAGASREDASPADMNLLAQYYYDMLENVAEAETWYKKVGEKDGDIEATLASKYFYITNASILCVAPETCEEYSQFISAHSHSYPKFHHLLELAQLNADIEAIKHEYHTERAKLSTGNPYLDKFLLEGGKEEDLKQWMDICKKDPVEGRRAFAKQQENKKAVELNADRFEERIRKATEYARVLLDQGNVVVQGSYYPLILRNRESAVTDVSKAVEFFTKVAHSANGSIGDEKEYEGYVKQVSDASATILAEYYTNLESREKAPSGNKKRLKKATAEKEYWQRYAELMGSAPFADHIISTIIAKRVEKILQSLTQDSAVKVGYSNEGQCAALVEPSKITDQLVEKLNKYGIASRYREDGLYILPITPKKLEEAYKAYITDGILQRSKASSAVTCL